MDDFLKLIFDPMTALFHKFREFLPNILAMLLILFIGIFIAFIARRIFVKLLVAIHFDKWADRMGFTKLMRQGDLWGKPSAMLGGMLFWILLIVTLMSSLSALHVAAIDVLVLQFFSYVPRIFTAAVIMLVGYVLSGFASRTVLITATNSGFHFAKVLAKAVQILLVVLILAMVMEQLQIAPGVVLAAFSIIFGGIVVALSIAFGVGGIDAARRVIEREFSAKHAEETKDEIEHI